VQTPFAARGPHLLLAAGIEDLDAFEPALLLAVIDVAEVKDVAMHNALAAAPATFHNGPGAMLFAVFKTAVTFQMHVRREL